MTTRKLTKNTKNGNLSLQSDSNGNYNNSLTKKLAGGSTVNYNSSGNINTGAFNNSTTKRTPTYLQGIDTGNGSYSASGNYSSGYNNLSSIEKPQYNPLSGVAKPQYTPLSDIAKPQYNPLSSIDKPQYTAGTTPNIKQDRTNSNNWQNQLDALYNQIANRSPFNYNQAEDPLYQQYAEMYANNAKLAMRDTVGQVASMTGGYGNSYAETAGQAMYNQQMDNLNQRALDLYNAAENRYINEGNRLNNLYSLAGNQYANAYNAENDEYNRQLAEWQMADQLRQEQNQYNMQMYDYDRQNAADYNDYLMRMYGYDLQNAADYNNYLMQMYDYDRQNVADYNDYLMRMYGYDLQNADSDRSFNWNVEQANKDDAFRQAQFAYQQQQDAIDNAYRQNAFDYEQYLNDRDFAYQQNMDAQNRADKYFSSGFATDANGNPTGDYAKWYAEQMAREDKQNKQNRLDAQNQFDAELAYKYAAQGLNPDGSLSAAYLAEKGYQDQINALQAEKEADNVRMGMTPDASTFERKYITESEIAKHMPNDADKRAFLNGRMTEESPVWKKAVMDIIDESKLNENEKDYLYVRHSLYK